MHPQLRSIPIFLVVLVVAIALMNGVADKYYWYWQMRWFDMPMHFSGGVWLAGAAYWWFLSKKTESVPFLRVLTICLAASFGVGFLWEIYEAVVSLITVGHINAMSDTLKDLSFDVIGGTTVTLWAWLKMKRAN